MSGGEPKKSFPPVEVRVPQSQACKAFTSQRDAWVFIKNNTTGDEGARRSLALTGGVGSNRGGVFWDEEVCRGTKRCGGGEAERVWSLNPWP